MPTRVGSSHARRQIGASSTATRTRITLSGKARVLLTCLSAPSTASGQPSWYVSPCPPVFLSLLQDLQPLLILSTSPPPCIHCTSPPLQLKIYTPECACDKFINGATPEATSHLCVTQYDYETHGLALPNPRVCSPPANGWVPTEGEAYQNWGCDHPAVPCKLHAEHHPFDAHEAILAEYRKARDEQYAAYFDQRADTVVGELSTPDPAVPCTLYHVPTRHAPTYRTTFLIRRAISQHRARERHPRDGDRAR